MIEGVKGSKEGREGGEEEGAVCKEGSTEITQDERGYRWY